MLDSGVLGVAIGLILIYFLLSLLCSGLNELMEAFLRRRSKYLEEAVVDLVGLDLKRQLYNHPLLETLYPQKGIPEGDEPVDRKKDRRHPSYIPAKVFSQALLMIVTEGSARLAEPVDASTERLPVDAATGFAPGFIVQIHEERMRITQIEPAPDDPDRPGQKQGPSWLTVDRGVLGTTKAEHAGDSRITRFREAIPSAADVAAELRSSLDRLSSGRLREVLGGTLTRAGSDLDRWREGIEAWFDDKMDRVSGWYGRRTRFWLFVYGIVIVVILNADTVLVARTLWGDGTLRDSIVAQAGLVVASGATDEPCDEGPDCVATDLNAIRALDLPLGWPSVNPVHWNKDAYAEDVRVPHHPGDWGLKIFGLVVTAAALTLGAPFWFDLLNKITNFRVSGPPPPRAPPSEGA
jgi:hypothetical protein